jgi:hypothetical protein
VLWQQSSVNVEKWRDRRWLARNISKKVSGESNRIHLFEPKDTIEQILQICNKKLTVLGACIGEKADAAVAKAATRRI